MGIEPETRDKLRRLTADRAEREELIEALQGAVDENEELRESAGRADRLEKEHGELKARVKSGDYRKAFDLAAKKAGVKPELLDDAWELAKVDTSGDAPDPRVITKGLDAFLEARPHYKGSAESEGEGQGEGEDETEAAGQGGGGKLTESPPAKLPKGAGNARGGPGKGPVGKMVVNRQDLNNFDWVLANGAEFSKQSAAGNVHFTGNAP